MKLDPERLGAQLSGALRPVYVISGDETLRVGEAADAVRAAARAHGYGEREVLFIERSTAAAWAGALEASRSRSLFAARRLLEIRLSVQPGSAGGPALQQLIESSGDELLLLVLLSRLDRDAQRAPWLQTAQARGVWVPVWPLDRSQLPQWLRRRLSAAGLGADEQALALLAERSEGNLLAASQEVAKLALLHAPGTQLSAADAAASSADSARFDVFKLIDAVQAGEAQRSLRILTGLRAEGAEPALVLWALVRALHARSGAPRPAGAGAGGRALPAGRLVARAARADRMVKGLAPGEAWDEFALLAGELCGLRTLPLVQGAGAY